MTTMLTRAVGLLSDPSADGVVAALAETDGRDEIRILGGISHPYDDRLRWRVVEAAQNDFPTLEMLRLGSELTRHHAEAFTLLCEAYPGETNRASLIGFQGHTIRHVPREKLLLELGDPWLLAALTGVGVVSDFRRHDMAIGGHGGPMAAIFHWALMAREPRPALMLNLGHVSSVTWLSRENEIVAGDTGPGVGLLTEWVQEMSDRAHDLDGAVSSRGTVHEGLVRAALEGPFFGLPLPKAAERNDFDHVDVSGLSAEDGAATLCAIIASSTVDAARRLPEMPSLLWVTGSGSEQPVVRERLKRHFDRVASVAERGLDASVLEACCYAWLAVRYRRRLPITTPETTGCRSAECAGFSTELETWLPNDVV
jgi:anhydro-N-acetylmuramic acid kinase